MDEFFCQVFGKKVLFLSQNFGKEGKPVVKQCEGMRV